MAWRTVALGATLAMAATTGAFAQAPAANARVVIGATKLPTVTDKPLHFRALSITLPTGGQHSVPAETGVLYQLAGSAEVAIGSETKTVNEGGGMFIAGGQTLALKATGNEPSNSLYFELLPVGSPLAETSANVKELYRTAQPIAGLKPGPHDLNLTRVTFAAQMASNPPHHRTGAALYYIVSGTGANTIDGQTEMKGPGTFILEPGGLVHQWGNPGSTPMTFLTFNLNQEGVPAVASDAPPRNP